MSEERARAIVKTCTGMDPTESAAAVLAAREMVVALIGATSVRWAGWMYPRGEGDGPQ